jgi:hypothetical protein
VLTVKAGIGLAVVADQAPKLFGLHIHKVSFFRILATIQALPGTSVVTLALSWPPSTDGRSAPPGASRTRPWPQSRSAASGLLGLKARGVDTIGAIVGPAGSTPPHVDLLVAL